MHTDQDSNPERPPRDSATVVLLRDGSKGLEVLLMQRSSQSRTLGGTYVFPGGKLEYSDSDAHVLSLLDQPPQTLRQLLQEPELTPEKAAGLFVAAMRETMEEAGVRFFDGPTQQAPWQAQAPGAQAPAGAHLHASALAPWSRWITPRHQQMINRRFDTRFFLAQLPAGQRAENDGFELINAWWATPREALERYANGAINLIPPQIVSIMHLALYQTAGQAMGAARSAGPALIEPEPQRTDDGWIMTYPGDPEHSRAQAVLPAALPTRLVMRGRHCAPPQGFARFLDQAAQLARP